MYVQIRINELRRKIFVLAWVWGASGIPDRNEKLDGYTERLHTQSAWKWPRKNPNSGNSELVHWSILLSNFAIKMFQFSNNILEIIQF